jgi:hypothetical protein
MRPTKAGTSYIPSSSGDSSSSSRQVKDVIGTANGFLTPAGNEGQHNSSVE